MPSYPLPAAVNVLFGNTSPQRIAASLKATRQVDECDMSALAAAQRRPLQAANAGRRQPAEVGATA